MTGSIDHRVIWRLVFAQRGAISRDQLLAFGLTRHAIQHRVDRGRLVVEWPGVYRVGQRPLDRDGRFVAAVLACGPGAILSHASAAELWGIHRSTGGPIHISIPATRRIRLKGITAHRRNPLPAATTKSAIPLTQPLFTLVDLASSLAAELLTAAINEADRLGLIDHDELVALVESLSGRSGIRKLRAILGTHARTDSNLERTFLALVNRANLPRPETQLEILGFRVDFAWPEIALVVETDGLTYHRTPSQQAADRKRDQVLMAAGLTCLRFTNAQIRSEPNGVIATLRSVYDSSARNASSSMISVPTFSAFASFDPGSAPSNR